MPKRSDLNSVNTRISPPPSLIWAPKEHFFWCGGELIAWVVSKSKDIGISYTEGKF